MARQNEVIDPRTHNSESVYKSWLRRIGRSTYRFKVTSRSDGYWEIRVDRSLGRGWETVHHWPTGTED